jgi:hypothetical protein
MMAFMHLLKTVDGNTRECGMVGLVFRVSGLKLLMEVPEGHKRVRDGGFGV